MTKNIDDLKGKQKEGAKKSHKRRRSHLMAHQKSKRTLKVIDESQSEIKV